MCREKMDKKQATVKSRRVKLLCQPDFLSCLWKGVTELLLIALGYKQRDGDSQVLLEGGGGAHSCPVLGREPLSLSAVGLEAAGSSANTQYRGVQLRQLGPILLLLDTEIRTGPT